MRRIVVEVRRRQHYLGRSRPFVWTIDPDAIIEKGPTRVSCVGLDGAADGLSGAAAAS